MALAEERLTYAGLELPPIRLKGNGVQPHMVVDDLLFVGGIGPLGDDGKLAYEGKLGDKYSVEEGYKAARLVGLNVLKHIKDALGGFDGVDCVLKTTVFVNGKKGFSDIFKVADGFSDVLAEALGERGVATRNAVGANSLNGNAPVVAEAIVKLRPGYPK